MKIPYIRLWIGMQTNQAQELCEPCADALYRFMGINTPGGGYEKLDSEVMEEGEAK
jgi:hypothetical protein